LKKTGLLLGMALTGMMLMTGCTSSADTLPSPSPSASRTPTNTPMTQSTQGPSMSPSATDGTGLMDGIENAADKVGGAVSGAVNGAMNGIENAGISTVEDAARVSDRIADEVEKLSELDDAEAIVAGNIALVGIEYDAQYQGGLTDRLVKMIEERVMAADKAITAVHVTDDPQTMKDISDLNDRAEDGKITYEELKTEVLEIGSSIAGGGQPNVSQPQTTTGAKK